MKLFRKKQEEQETKVSVEEANKQYDKLQYEIDELGKYSTMFCPLVNIGLRFCEADIHNHILYTAINERTAKLEKQQKEIEA